MWVLVIFGGNFYTLFMFRTLRVLYGLLQGDNYLDDKFCYLFRHILRVKFFINVIKKKKYNLANITHILLSLRDITQIAHSTDKEKRSIWRV